MGRPSKLTDAQRRRRPAAAAPKVRPSRNWRRATMSALRRFRGWRYEPLPGFITSAERRPGQEFARKYFRAFILGGSATCILASERSFPDEEVVGHRASQIGVGADALDGYDW